MAWIERREGKRGVSYRISVSCGMDSLGHQIMRRTTWRPEPGMTARQTEKALARAAADFEREIEQGYALDNRQTFAEYAKYVLTMKGQAGAKRRTLERYEELLERINRAIGHMKLADIRPQHLNSLYQNLQEAGIRKDGGHATMRIDLEAWLKDHKTSKTALAQKAGCAASTLGTAGRGQSIQRSTAEAIARAMGGKLESIFDITVKSTPLSPKTVLEHHRLISTVLGQAEKEMLVPYNAAAKATPPKVDRKEPNYFQPEDIAAILDALEREPLKWRTIIHLLIITGCRRGEVMGLKWDKVDLDRQRITIDRALLVGKSGTAYEDTTKTGDTRYLNIPAETVQLLREYRREQTIMRLKNGDRWNDTGYVFTRDNGRPMNPESVNSWLNDFSKKNGLPHINPHAFRHTAASVLIAAGTDVVTVSKQLGHSSVNTTESFYSHMIEEAKAQATECIADVLLRKRSR